MSVQTRRGDWLLTLPLVGLAAGYLFLFYLPGQQAIGEATDKIDQQTQVIEGGVSLLGVLQTAEEESEKATDFVSVWEEHAPAVDNLSKLYGDIYALAERAGTTITRFTPEAAVPGEQIVKIPLKMGCRGRFSQVFSFLTNLEKTGYEVWTPSLRMERGEESGQSVHCELSLVVFANNSKNSGDAKQSD